MSRDLPTPSSKGIQAEIVPQETLSAYNYKDAKDDGHPEEITPLSNLYTLIIGIDKYASDKISPLYGAVADANAMADYVETRLKASKKRIIILRDAEATREAIINAFKFMAGDFKSEGPARDAFKEYEEPQTNAPILIYYAGHGSTASRQDNLSEGEPVMQLIVPSDCTDEVLDSPPEPMPGREQGFKHAERKQSAAPRNGVQRDVQVAEEGSSKGSKVHAIPDRTLNGLLQILAEAKGDNITVIFDCCHSGSGTRDSMLGRERGFTLKESPPKNIDAEILKQVSSKRGAKVPTGFAYVGLSSHVLLAACHSKETARERQGRGAFTTALLEALKESRNVTCKDLIRDLGVLHAGSPTQTPQCEGQNGDRVIFTKHAPMHRRARYRVLVESGTYALNVGAVQGITAGDMFDIHLGQQDSQETFRGVLQAGTAVETSRTVLKPTHAGFDTKALSSAAFAFESRSKEKWATFQLRIKTPEGLTGELKAFQEYISRTDQPWECTLIDDKKDLKRNRVVVELILRDGHGVFCVSDHELMHNYGLSPRYHLIPLDPPLPRLADVVLDGIAHYYWHLNRKDVKTPGSLHSKVNVELVKLKSSGKLDEYFQEELTPDGPGISPTTDGKIEVTANDGTLYGIRLTNTAKAPLYASVFYFNSRKLSITSLYQPPIARSTGNSDGAPLRPESPLTIGYGSDGAQPHTYTFDSNQKIDVDFLKIFLSTIPVDLSCIPQPSPFDFRVDRDLQTIQRDVKGFWDTITIAVVQHAPPTEENISRAKNAGSSVEVRTPTQAQGSVEAALPSIPNSKRKVKATSRSAARDSDVPVTKEKSSIEEKSLPKDSEKPSRKDKSRKAKSPPSLESPASDFTIPKDTRA